MSSFKRCGFALASLLSFSLPLLLPPESSAQSLNDAKKEFQKQNDYASERDRQYNAYCDIAAEQYQFTYKQYAYGGGYVYVDPDGFYTFLHAEDGDCRQHYDHALDYRRTGQWKRKLGEIYEHGYFGEGVAFDIEGDEFVQYDLNYKTKKIVGRTVRGVKVR